MYATTISKHMKKLCDELGRGYKIQTIDCEKCITKKLYNGYEVEISGANTLSKKKPVKVYLWDMKTREIVDRFFKVKQTEIKSLISELALLTYAGAYEKGGDVNISYT